MKELRRRCRDARLAGALAASLGLGWAGCGSAGRSRMPAQDITVSDYTSIRQAASPADAYLAWKAGSTGVPVSQVRAADQALSTSRNPFSVNDAAAVRGGALVYSAHCASCHGEHADGRGPLAKDHSRGMDFHATGKAHSIFFAGGVPKDWFRKVNEGYTNPKSYSDGSPRAMPAFGQTLSREQIWLALTYLHAVVADKAPAPTQ